MRVAVSPSGQHLSQYLSQYLALPAVTLLLACLACHWTLVQANSYPNCPPSNYARVGDSDTWLWKVQASKIETWHEAMTECRNNGNATLVLARSQQEQDLILGWSGFRKNYRFWLALKREKGAGSDWRWYSEPGIGQTGTPMDWENFEGLERPYDEDKQGRSHCASMKTGRGGWKDWRCNRKVNTVCQIHFVVPVPFLSVSMAGGQATFTCQKQEGEIDEVIFALNGKVVQTGGETSVTYQPLDDPSSSGVYTCVVRRCETNSLPSNAYKMSITFTVGGTSTTFSGAGEEDTAAAVGDVSSMNNRLHDMSERLRRYFIGGRPSRGGSDGFSVQIVNPPKLQCGQRPKRPQAFISRGETATHGDYPWQARMAMLKPGNKVAHLCGLTIINSYWLLTAAHCFNILKTIPAAKFIIFVGDFDTRTPNDPGEQWFFVEKHILHEGFDSQTLENDIALVKITSIKTDLGIQYNDYVQPACLAASTMPHPVGKTCLVSGWGQLRDDVRDSPKELQAAEVEVWSDSQCKLNSNTRICAAGRNSNGVGTCQGDSGGPLVCDMGGTYTLFGVTSFGRRRCGEATHPDYFTRVSTFIPWINQHMSD